MSLKKGTIDIGTIIKGDTTKKVEENDVNFYDYLGNLVYSYSAEEFLELSDFPPLPTYPGMTYTNWNWSFEDAYDYVYRNGALDIGGICETSDEKNRIYINLDRPDLLDIKLRFGIQNIGSLIIDWGDESELQTVNNNVPNLVEKIISHSYSNIGKYIIEISSVNNCIMHFAGYDLRDTYGASLQALSRLLFDDSSTTSSTNKYLRTIYKIELSKHININCAAFAGLLNLESINFPQVEYSFDTTSFMNYGFRLLNLTDSLNFVVIPNTIGVCQGIKGTGTAVNKGQTTIIYPNNINPIRSISETLYSYINNKRIFLPTNISTINMSTNTTNMIYESNVKELFISEGYTNYSGYCNVHTLHFPSTLNTIQRIMPNPKLDFLKLTHVPALSTNTVTTSASDPHNNHHTIIIPGSLYYEWINSTNWITFKDYIVPIGEIIEPELSNISINMQVYNIYKKHNFDIIVTYNNGSYCPEEKKGFALTVNSGPATVDGNTLIVNNTAQDGDEISITVTSTYDNTISDTKTITLSYVEESYTINLNEGQWVLTEDVGPNNEPIYKSDAGSYHINNGKSTCIITVNGYTSFKVMIYSDAESSYDYTEAFAANTTTPSRGSGLYTTKSTQKQWIECSYTLDGGEHTIPIMYSKDSSADSGEDRGRFYIVEE